MTNENHKIGLYNNIIHNVLESLPEFNQKTPKSQLPINGIYFFYEIGETCIKANKGQKRIVRVGTHSVNGNLRQRIYSHFRGNKNSSVFRKHLGGALIRRRVQNDKSALFCLA